MTPTVLVAARRQDVINAFDDARVQHTLVNCWIAPDESHVSWVCYRTEADTFARLMYYPDVP